MFFALGNATQGVMYSSFWAVIRTETYFQSKNGQEGKNAALFSGMRFLATALGTLGAGFLLAYFSFENVLIYLLLISLLLFIPTLLMKNKKRKISLRKTFSLLSLRKKEIKFWFSSLAVAFWGVAFF